MNELIDALKIAFNELIDKNDWMDPKTRDYAKQKVLISIESISILTKYLIIQLNSMLRAIGYPDFIKDDEKLSAYYSGVNH